MNDSSSTTSGGSLRVAVVLLAYDSEPTLVRAVDAILASEGCEVELLVVDNGAAPEVLDQVRLRAGVRVLGPARNRGFAGGCNEGVAATSAPIIALVNSDAFVAADALARLASVAAEPGVGIASGCIVLDEHPDRLNSAGNPIHFSGLTWSGAYGEPVAEHQAPRDVPSASGAGLALRREVWEQLGGFDDAYFAYLEDTDLSVRCWQLDLRVVYVPDAVVRHMYEFSRNERKLYLLERNRLLLLLTTYELRTLVLLSPALLLVEFAMLAQAAAGGWLPRKLAGYRWLLRHAAHVRRRRRSIQAARVLDDRALQRRRVYCARIEPANVDQPPGLGLLNAVLAGWWRVVTGR